MLDRLTFINIHPERVEDLRRIYNEEIVPVVKEQKGNISVWLLEPTSSAEDFIWLTEWGSEADTNAYESGGIYKMLTDKIKDMYTIRPIVRTYNIAESKIAVTM
jgi:heme-degrading monooxygenase HmoA